MTTFVFKGKDGKAVYANLEGAVFAFSDKPEVSTYVYANGRNGSSGVEVLSEQINRTRMDFVLYFMATNGPIWKVNFSDPNHLVFNDTIVAAPDSDAPQAAPDIIPTDKLTPLGQLQVARPK